MFAESKPEHFKRQAASGKRQAASAKRQAPSAKRQAPSAKRQAPSAKRQALKLRSFRRAADIRHKLWTARFTKLFVIRGGLVHRIPYEFLLSRFILAESSPKYP